MIAAREEEIRQFKPQEYYGLTLMAGGLRFSWQDEKSGSRRSFSKERMEDMKSRIGNGILEIKEIEKTGKKTYAPGLYDLTELQRDANKKFRIFRKRDSEHYAAAV